VSSLLRATRRAALGSGTDGFRSGSLTIDLHDVAEKLERFGAGRWKEFLPMIEPKPPPWAISRTSARIGEGGDGDAVFLEDFLGLRPLDEFLGWLDFDDVSAVVGSTCPGFPRNSAREFV